MDNRPQQMFPEDEWGKGMTKEQEERLATNLCVSMMEAKEYKQKELIGAKVE